MNNSKRENVRSSGGDGKIGGCVVLETLRNTRKNYTWIIDRYANSDWRLNNVHMRKTWGETTLLLMASETIKTRLGCFDSVRRKNTNHGIMVPSISWATTFRHRWQLFPGSARLLSAHSPLFRIKRPTSHPPTSSPKASDPPTPRTEVQISAQWRIEGQNGTSIWLTTWLSAQPRDGKKWSSYVPGWTLIFLGGVTPQYLWTVQGSGKQNT